MLYKWSEKGGDNATYRKLAERFKQCGRQDIVDEIKRLVAGGTGESMLSFNLLKFNCGNGQKKTYCYSCFGTPVKGPSSTSHAASIPGLVLLYIQNSRLSCINETLLHVQLKNARISVTKSTAVIITLSGNPSTVLIHFVHVIMM